MNTYHVKDMVFVNSCKKNVFKITVYSVLIFTTLTISLIPNIFSKKNYLTQRQKYPTDMKYILFWTEKQKKTYLQRELQEGQNLFIEQNCKFINCYISYNKSMLQGDERNFDAIVFNIKDVERFNYDEIDLERHPSQKYIFNSLESSERHPVCNPLFENFFNVTWTYKLNSDIPHPFINILDSKNNIVGPKLDLKWVVNMTHGNKFKSKIRNKKKGVAWFVNKCHSKIKYQEFIKDLRKELKGYNYSVDLFGPCGQKKCPDGDETKCYKFIEKQYYFQLVIEDSFAEDYVTENIVKIMNQVIIPIVFSGSEYKSFLPPGSYINIQAFDIKKLGALIDYLIKNPKTYEYFLDWKNHYQYTVRPRSDICDLCTKLNSDTRSVKSYSNFRQWWNSDYVEACRTQHIFNMFDNELKHPEKFSMYQRVLKKINRL